MTAIGLDVTVVQRPAVGVRVGDHVLLRDGLDRLRLVEVQQVREAGTAAVHVWCSDGFHLICLPDEALTVVPL